MNIMLILNGFFHRASLRTMGQSSKSLSQELLAYLDIPRIELVSSGTLAIQALNLNGEIITTPYSYVATTTAVPWEGCDPVFVDIDAKTFCINADLIESAITERTSAILATHVYGSL